MNKYELITEIEKLKQYAKDTILAEQEWEQDAENTEKEQIFDEAYNSEYNQIRKCAEIVMKHKTMSLETAMNLVTVYAGI